MPPLAMEVDKENAGRPATFSSAQLQQLVGNCLKLASENKITVQNTWSLPLIENLPNLIKDEGEQTNFQRASVTLDAGVKIYSTRVDSVHTETFKILGTMGRAGSSAENEAGEEGAGEGEEGDGGGDGAGPKRRRRALVELNEAATLEANMDALTLKKFDLAFAVDPLFKKTSAQFDEGGAKGLLLNNLSVYNGCDIVFDSMDVPETAVDTAQDQPSMLVSLAAVQGKLDMVLRMTGQERISPTLDDILQLLGQAPGEGAAAAADEFVRQVAAAGGDVQPTTSASLMQTSTFSGDGLERAAERDPEDGGVEGYVAHAAGAPAPGLADMGDYDDGYGGGGDEDSGGFDAGGGFDDYFSDNEGQESVAQQQQTFSAAKGGRQSLGGDALQWLVSAGTLNMAGKGWAGGSHWRYRALPQQGGAEGEEDGGKKKRAATRKKNDPLDFVALLEQPEQPTFEKLPATRVKRARAAGARAAKPVALLPEDHHYQPEVLVRYALRPRQAVRGRSGESSAGAAVQGAELCSQLDFGGDFGGGFSDGGDDGPGDFGGWDDTGFGGAREGEGDGDAGEEAALAVRRVEKVEVNYSKAAKQVDVRALKEALWEGIHQVLPPGQQQDAVLSFQDVLSTVQERNPAGRVEDLSVHLCFICVLHLANDHGLVIKGVPELDQLTISNVPAA